MNPEDQPNDMFKFTIDVVFVYDRTKQKKKLTALTPMTPKRVLAPNIRTMACTSPSIVPKISAVDADAICFLPFFVLLLIEGNSRSVTLKIHC